MKKIFVLVALLVAYIGVASAQWRYFENADPMTDRTIRVAFLPSTDSTRTLVYRDNGNNTFEVFILWNEYMITDDRYYLLMRLDTEAPIEVPAHKSFNSEGSFIQDVRLMTGALKRGIRRIVVRITEKNGGATTVVFDTSAPPPEVMAILPK